jgi:hypothetical protein
VEKLKQFCWDFLASASLSSFYAFDLNDQPQWDERPPGAILVNGRWVPESPDGLTIGNREVYAAIGVPELLPEYIHEFYQGSGNYEYHIYPSRMSLLVGPNKYYTHLKSLFTTRKFQDFLLHYTRNEKIVQTTLALAENKKLFRIRETPIAIGDIEDQDIQVKIIDFAPTAIDNTDRDPAVICRYVLIRNIGQEKLTNIQFGPLLVNFGESWHLQSTNKESIPDKPNLNHIIITESQNNGECFGILGQFSHLWMGIEPDEVDNSVQIAKLKQTGQIFENSEGIDEIGVVALSHQIKELDPGESVILPYFFIPAMSKSEENQSAAFVAQANWKVLLESTYFNARKWSNAVYIKTSDNKVNDLLDSILNLLKLHVSDNALHTGSVYYEHHSAFVRDNYWFAWAMLKAGRFDAAVINADFFFKSWQKCGIRNSYTTESYGGGVSAKEMRVEIPAYFPLMVYDLSQWGTDPQLLPRMYPMAHACMDLTLSCPNDLFILNSDETWIWPAFVNEIDYYTDTSWVMIAGIHATERMAHILRKDSEVNHWESIKSRWIKAAHFAFTLPTSDQLIKSPQITSEIIPRYAAGMDHDNHRDESLLPSVLSRPVTLRLLPLLEASASTLCESGIKLFEEYSPTELVRNGLALTWEIMKKDRIIRSHSKTSSFVGNTPGYYLYAVSELDLPWKDDVFASIFDAVDCTGSMYEIHDLYYPAWGTERRRIWDSANILAGMLHYLYGIEPDENAIVFKPNPPHQTGYSVISDIPVKGRFFRVIARSLDYIEMEDEHELSELNLSENSFKPDHIITHDLENRENLEYISESISQTWDLIKEEYFYTNSIIRTISFRSNQESAYQSLVESDCEGAIRYYPDSDTIELGLRHDHDLQPILIFHSAKTFNNNNQTPTNELQFHPECIDHGFIASLLGKIQIIVNFESDETIQLIIGNGTNQNLLIWWGSEKFELGIHAAYSGKLVLSKPSTLHETPVFPISDFFLNRLETIITKNGTPNCIVLYDAFSKGHALEIIKTIAIIKSRIFPMREIKMEQSLLEQANGFNVICVMKGDLEGSGFVTDGEHIQSYYNCDLWSFNNSSSYFLISVPNRGHVYDDTHYLCEMLGVYLTPSRYKAMSMHPYGHLRLSDTIGMPATLPFPVEIIASSPVNFYLGGTHTFAEKVSMVWDPTKKSQLFKPQKPYCSFYTIQPFAPFEVAAAGIATGANCIRFLIDCDADTPIEISFTIRLNQLYHPVSLSGGQRERILDPTELHKLADGSKKLQITLHPGRKVHEIINPHPQDATKRSLMYLFAHYPKHA